MIADEREMVRRRGKGTGKMRDQEKPMSFKHQRVPPVCPEGGVSKYHKAKDTTGVE
jgi:hypothetical protein